MSGKKIPEWVSSEVRDYFERNNIQWDWKPFKPSFRDGTKKWDDNEYSPQPPTEKGQDFSFRSWLNGYTEDKDYKFFYDDSDHIKVHLKNFITKDRLREYYGVWYKKPIPCDDKEFERIKADRDKELLMSRHARHFYHRPKFTPISEYSYKTSKSPQKERYYRYLEGKDNALDLTYRTINELGKSQPRSLFSEENIDEEGLNVDVSEDDNELDYELEWEGEEPSFFDGGLKHSTDYKYNQELILKDKIVKETKTPEDYEKWRKNHLWETSGIDYKIKTRLYDIFYNMSSYHSKRRELIYVIYKTPKREEFVFWKPKDVYPTIEEINYRNILTRLDAYAWHIHMKVEECYIREKIRDNHPDWIDSNGNFNYKLMMLSIRRKIWELYNPLIEEQTLIPPFKERPNKYEWLSYTTHTFLTKTKYYKDLKTEVFYLYCNKYSKLIDLYSNSENPALRDWAKEMLSHYFY